MPDFLIHFFDGLVTLIVGSSAIFIYQKRMRDDKRNAANVILNEIRGAEKLFKDAKAKILEAKKNTDATQIPEHHYLMPQMSWGKYKHLFIKDFNETQLSAIDDFYQTCQLFDETIVYMDAIFQEDTKEIRKNVHKALYKTITKFVNETNNATNQEELEQKLIEKKNAIAGALTNSEYMYSYLPTKPFKAIEVYIETIDANLSLNSVGTKLEKLAQSHWW